MGRLPSRPMSAPDPNSGNAVRAHCKGPPGTLQFKFRSNYTPARAGFKETNPYVDMIWTCRLVYVSLFFWMQDKSPLCTRLAMAHGTIDRETDHEENCAM